VAHIAARYTEDYVIATGITTKVRDFIQMAFAEVGFNLRFEGEGVDEIGILDSFNNDLVKSVLGNFEVKIEIGTVLVRVDPMYFRPTEVDLLIGDATKAYKQLGWKPKYDLIYLLKEMVASDVSLFKKDLQLIDAGHTVYLPKD